MQDNLLTIIIPIHQNGDMQLEYTKKCIDSVANQTMNAFSLFVVYSKEVPQEYKTSIENYIQSKNMDIQSVDFTVNDGDCGYASQVNMSVNGVNTKFFSILQYDDTIMPKFVESFYKHTMAYPKTRMFCNLVAETDPTNKFIGMSNESVWAVGTMERFGYFDLKNTKAQKYFNFSICGAIIATDNFKACGKFKGSFKFFGDYEFLLRYLHRGNEVFVIPHINYKHTNGLQGSIYDQLQGSTDEERKFWHETSRKEYYFDFEREIATPN